MGVESSLEKGTRMMYFDTSIVLLILVFLSFIPVTWVQETPFIPRAVQSLGILASAGLVLMAYRVSRRKVLLFALLPVYIAATLLTNILVATIWHVYIH
jgi:hypothetical protein